jgi:hypothetical protein
VSCAFSGRFLNSEKIDRPIHNQPLSDEIDARIPALLGLKAANAR